MNEIIAPQLNFCLLFPNELNINYNLLWQSSSLFLSAHFFSIDLLVNKLLFVPKKLILIYIICAQLNSLLLLWVTFFWMKIFWAKFFKLDYYAFYVINFYWGSYISWVTRIKTQIDEWEKCVYVYCVCHLYF
jgi:hypothetical protein